MSNKADRKQLAFGPDRGKQSFTDSPLVAVRNVRFTAESGRRCQLEECPLLAEAVEKLLAESLQRNKRTEEQGGTNHSCAAPRLDESILRLERPKIVFQQPQPVPDMGGS
jgi:hypothetical protein